MSDKDEPELSAVPLLVESPSLQTSHRATHSGAEASLISSIFNTFALGVSPAGKGSPWLEFFLLAVPTAAGGFARSLSGAVAVLSGTSTVSIKLPISSIETFLSAF